MAESEKYTQRVECSLEPDRIEQNTRAPGVSVQGSAG